MYTIASVWRCRFMRLKMKVAIFKLLIKMCFYVNIIKHPANEIQGGI